jgi:hypothetical protein
MKVRCVQVMDLMGEKVRASTWLTIGATYHVLEILIDPNGKDYLKFRIRSDNNGTPIIERASAFELITNSIPSCWSVSFLPNSLLYLAPVEWMESGFGNDF